MRYSLPSNNLYGNKPVMIEIPNEWDVKICSFNNAKAKPLSYEEIKTKIVNRDDIKIVDIAKNKKSAIIILDDITRPTPCEEISLAVISELNKVGISNDNIRFVFAVGCHRAMNREEMVRKLGEEIVSNYKIFSHNPFFNCENIGFTSNGVPIEVNKDVLEADVKIAVGSVTPHAAVGVGGGSKIILPGIASFNAIKEFHLRTEKDRWNINSIGKQMSDEFAKKINLDLKIDAMLNGKGEICELLVGKSWDIIPNNISKIIDAFKTPCDLSGDIYLVNNYFKPSETKLALSGNGLLKHIPNNSTIIVSANSPQGSALHYLFGNWGERIGGAMYKGLNEIPDNISKYIALSKYRDIGIGQSWHYNGKNFLWESDFNNIVKMYPGKHKLIIYPYASVSYFEPNGNIG